MRLAALLLLLLATSATAQVVTCDYGGVEPDSEEVLKDGNVIEKIAYRYVRDQHGNWTERIASVMDPRTFQMVDVRRDTRTLTYY